MHVRKLLVLSVALALTACGSDKSTNTPDAARSVDADPSAPDADPSAPDADPNAPDADPSAPDAGMTTPDGGTDCAPGLNSCNGSCVDLNSNHDNCSSCNRMCGASQTCVLGDCVDGVGDLVISEVHNFDPGYVELYNGGATAIALGGHQIQWIVDGAGSGAFVIPTLSLGAGEFIELREGNGSDGPGLVFLGDDIDWVDNIAVRLLAPSGVGLDFVRTAESTVTPGTGDNWTAPNPVNPSPTIDQSLVRNVFIADSNTEADWSLESRGSPGDFCPAPGRCGDACFDFAADRLNCGGCGVTCSSTQLCIDSVCQTGYVGPWISEYRRYPRPAIEIHNPTPNAIDITGYRLDISGATNLSYIFPSHSLAPGQFVVIYMGDGEPDGTSLYTGSTAAFGPTVGVGLFDDGTTALDFVRFGSSSAPAPGGTFWFGANIASPEMGPDQSARRNIETFDTDSAADWTRSSPSTPGFACYPGLSMCSGSCVATAVDDSHCGDCTTVCGPNERCNSGTCTSAGAVVISELRNYSAEYIELFNASDAPVNLDGWQIEWVADGGGDNYTISGLTINPGAIYYFYESGTGVSGNRVGMGTTISWSDFIAVTLKNAAGAAVDFVRTGSSVTTPPTGTAWTGANATNPSTSSSTTGSLTRNVFAADTDTAADWSIADDSQGLLCSRTDQQVCGNTCVRLSDNRDNCGACGNTCGLGSSCFQSECVDEGSIRLAVVSGTDGISSGRIEVFERGRWNNVGWDSTWGNTDANVACKQLGFASGTGTTRTYGSCTGCGRFYNIGCTGTEPRLFDCPHSQSSASASGYRVFCSE